MPVHPNSLANLKPTQWKPGQSGNPAGRPPGMTVYGRIVEKLRNDPEALERVAEAFQEALERGDPAFFRLMLERQDPAKHHAELTLPQLHEGISLLPRPAPRDVLAEPDEPQALEAPDANESTEG